MTFTRGGRQVVPPAGVDSDPRVARRSKVASVAMVVVLLAVSVFALWSSQATSTAAERAVSASGLSDDYSGAANAVGTEESLERKYRLEPGPDVQLTFDAAAARFVTAMMNVWRDGSADDRSFLQGVLALHTSYLKAIDRLFRAIDRGDAAAAMRIDNAEADPSFGSMETAVQDAAESHHQESIGHLESLRRLESVTRRLTPLVFLLGLFLAAALAAVSTGHRRLLVDERAQAVHASLHDTLTGLANRTLLAERLEQTLRADVRAGTGTGLLLLDLDRFKEINDTFGHHYGDELLTQIGSRLSAAVRDVDTLARLGGDEFAVLLPGIRSVDAAVAVATELRAALEAPFSILGVDLSVEASVGVVTSGEHGQDATVLLQRADIAMYVAKAESGGVSTYDPTLDERTPEKLTLLGDLRRALERDELVLHYQPKVGVSCGEVTGVEALVRWQHPERGLVFPDDFIPMAEHTGLIGALSRRVLDLALAQARTWADAGEALTVSVNLSARNLLDERMPAMVSELLACHGVAPALLVLEVTESALMTEPVRAKRLLEELAGLGLRISIDDFGAGYTSLGQLKALPVSELKIDKSFVMTMSEDNSDDLIVHSLIDLGHNLGLSIVAEGVEDEQTLAALRRYGCDVAQGYHLSRPLVPGALAIWRAGRRPGPVQTTSEELSPKAGVPIPQ